MNNLNKIEVASNIFPDSDKKRIEAFVKEYNYLLDLIGLPTDGIYIAVMTRRTIIRQTCEGNDCYVGPFAIIVAYGKITNRLKGIDLTRGDIRLSHPHGHFNHPDNNCKNYLKWIEDMVTDRLWYYANPDNVVLKSHWDINNYCLERLQALLMGPVKYIKIEENRIVFPKDLYIPGTVNRHNEIYEKWPGVYVGYEGIRIKNTDEDYAVFGSYTIPSEEEEVKNHNQKVLAKVDKLRSMLCAAHPNKSIEEREEMLDELRSKYELYIISRKYHYHIVQVVSQ